MHNTKLPGPYEPMPQWVKEELADGDRICEAAGVQRTEGGRLPVGKIIAALRAARPEAAGYDIAKAQDAAWAFRESLVPRADSMLAGKFPLWHGWAIFDAFMAGADFARSPLAEPTPAAPPVYVFNEHGRMVGFAFR